MSREQQETLSNYVNCIISAENDNNFREAKDQYDKYIREHGAELFTMIIVALEYNDTAHTLSNANKPRSAELHFRRAATVFLLMAETVEASEKKTYLNGAAEYFRASGDSERANRVLERAGLFSTPESASSPQGASSTSNFSPRSQ